MKIMEVSEQSGISSDTLRYYERIGLLPPVNRNGSGIRDYSEVDLKRVDFSLKIWSHTLFRWLGNAFRNESKTHSG